MIPVKSNNHLHFLEKQPIYGLENRSRWAWNLWAGYCAFDFTFTNNKELNFLYDFSNGLDTGGRNFKNMYQKLDKKQLAFASNKQCEIINPKTKDLHWIEMVDDAWYHIGGIGYANNFVEKSAVFVDLAEELSKGLKWDDLTIKSSIVGIPK